MRHYVAREYLRVAALIDQTVDIRKRAGDIERNQLFREIE